MDAEPLQRCEQEVRELEISVRNARYARQRLLRLRGTAADTGRTQIDVALQKNQDTIDALQRQLAEATDRLRAAQQGT